MCRSNLRRRLERLEKLFAKQEAERQKDVRVYYPFKPEDIGRAFNPDIKPLFPDEEAANG